MNNSNNDGVKINLPNPDGYIARDFRWNEKDDYRLNILPYKQRGYIPEPVGTHQYGYYIIHGWKILSMGSGRA